MKRNNSIDLFKLIAAFFIMTLHTSYGSMPVSLEEIIKLSGRWAVPFFFMSTGYFLNKKITSENHFNFNKIENNVTSLISILIIASIAYLPLNYINTSQLFEPEVNIIFNGSFYHLWFIGSLIFGYVTIWYLYFIGKSNLLLPLSLLIAILGILSNSYDKFFGIDLEFYKLFRSSLSIPFMYAGLLVSKSNLTKKNLGLLFIIYIGGFIIQYVEANMFYSLFSISRLHHEFLAGTIVSVIPMFVLITHLKIGENVFSRWGRKYALFLYLYHLYAYWILNLLLSKIFPLEFDIIKMFMPFIGFIALLGFVILLNRYFPVLFGVLNGTIISKK